MRVAVVTPFYNTPAAWLDACHRSVRAQTHPSTHILVSDGSETSAPADFEGHLVRLDQPHADNGNTPRAAGSAVAMGKGFDAIAYLDADNLFREDHIASLVTAHQSSRAPLCTSARTLMDLEGHEMGVCDEVDGVNFADTSCLFLTRAAYALTLQWVVMPRNYSVICDFWFWSVVRKNRIKTAHTGQPTLSFRTSYPHHFASRGKPTPQGAKSESYVLDCARRILSLGAIFGADAAMLSPLQGGAQSP